MYITLGGLKAAAVTDALQGLLILFFTILMIPLGLIKVGGLHALHQSVPEFMFRLFGTVATSDYAWYSILAITFTSMIQIFGLSGNMGNSGSAKDEETARFGQITGAFAKRLVIIAWMFCGLLAVALFPGGLADTENIWGIMSKSLLGPGLMGLMLSGMLLGHMPAIGSNAIAVSALIARNIYEPLVKGKSDQHYLRVGQTLVVLTLAVSVVSSMLFFRRGEADDDHHHLQRVFRRGGASDLLLAAAHRPRGLGFPWASGLSSSASCRHSCRRSRACGAG